MYFNKSEAIKSIEKLKERDCSEQKRLNVVMDKGMYKLIKEHCVQNDISISEITRVLWVDYMSKLKVSPKERN